MTQYQITLTDEVVHGPFREDGAMAKLVEQVLNQVLEAEVTEALKAKRYERTEERQGDRNGFKPRTMTTRVGRLTLSVPQVRDGKFSPELFSRFQRSEQALILALMEMVINGVSTRKVAKITEELCGTEFSKSTVSELCKRLDPKRLRTTNGIERLNEEMRRRERVIRIFPSVESAVRLLGALLMEKDEAWSTGRQYFDMREYL